MIVREALVRRIIESAAPVVVLDAVAGMGKSVLLSQVGQALGVSVHRGVEAPLAEGHVVLWDVPNYGNEPVLPEAFLSGPTRIVLAKRPAQRLAGLDRAEVYGAVLRLGKAELAMTEAEIGAARLAETGGWPLLLRLRDPEAPAVERFLRQEVVAALGHGDLVRLGQGLAGGGGHSLGDLLPEALPPSILRPLGAATRAEIAGRCVTQDHALAIAQAFEAENLLPDAIAAYQGAGRFDLALQALERGRSDFFIHLYGAEAFDRVLAGFPEAFVRTSETLLVCRAMQALKRGQVPLARRMLADWHGPAGNDPAVVFAPNSGYSLKFRAFRLIMLIYEDIQLSEALTKRIFTLLEEFPLEDHLSRGSFYNAVLEFFARNRRFAEAEDLARRARYHYQMAKVPLLVFYISLHQSMVRLISGDPISALSHAQMAAEELASVPFESPSDQRLLTLLMACIHYEGGKVEPLARFLNLEFDDFSNGEIWPNLIELALYYGSLALSQHYSTLSARSFLDRWRVYELRNLGLAAMMDLREVVLLQNANRWQEAAERLGQMPQRITRAWVQAHTDDLAKLSDRDELAAALLWLRHMAFEGPKRAGLVDKLTAISRSPVLTARQRIGVEIWLAHCNRWQRNLSAARAGLLAALETADALGAVAPLTEERPFLADLLDNASIASFLDASPAARHVLRKMRDAGTLRGAADRTGGLTRQETRILQAVCAGGSNKHVAHVFGLSEATVKFHLSNTYAKLGCKGRKEAIRAASALGLVG